MRHLKCVWVWVFKQFVKLSGICEINSVSVWVEGVRSDFPCQYYCSWRDHLWSTAATTQILCKCHILLQINMCGAGNGYWVDSSSILSYIILILNDILFSLDLPSDTCLTWWADLCLLIGSCCLWQYDQCYWINLSQGFWIQTNVLSELILHQKNYSTIPTAGSFVLSTYDKVCSIWLCSFSRYCSANRKSKD